MARESEDEYICKRCGTNITRRAPWIITVFVKYVMRKKRKVPRQYTEIENSSQIEKPS